jgi:serine/threonine-protein kinase HipA
LYAAQSAVLAPLYDAFDGGLSDLDVQDGDEDYSKYKFSEVQAQHWEQFAEAVGLSKAQARKRILALAKSMPSTARELQSDPGVASPAMAWLSRS